MKGSQGLARKGYLYTDRPAYQPGQKVEARGIIRDVADGSYVAPAGEVYLVSLLDGAPGVFDTAVSGGPVMPGESVTIQITARSPSNRISAVGMLITTNDAFFAINGARRPVGSRLSVLKLRKVMPSKASKSPILMRRSKALFIS